MLTAQALLKELTFKKKRKSIYTNTYELLSKLFFPVTYGYESWAVKDESQRNDAFELWCWRRLLSVPWAAKGSTQLILKETNPEYSLEGLMLKQKLQ